MKNDNNEGIKINLNTAQKILEKSIQLARSVEDVPQAWIENTSIIAESPSKTYLTFLGTALLARATDPRIDALTVKKSAGTNAYSTRNLAHKVLVPMSVDHNIDLLLKGREPLNNQPFFSHDRVDQMDRITGKSRETHELLVKYLNQINTMSQKDAFLALSAYLRNRINAARVNQTSTVPLLVDSSSLGKVIEITKAFIYEDAEGGKRAQALVAAVFDFTFKDVRTRRVNDPSRHFPGDVQGFKKEEPKVAAEVRAKKVVPTELIQFSNKVAGDGIPHAMMVALAPDQEPLPRGSTVRQLMNDLHIYVSVIESVEELFYQALAWSKLNRSEVTSVFPELMRRRLIDLEVSAKTKTLWNKLWE